MNILNKKISELSYFSKNSILSTYLEISSIINNSFSSFKLKFTNLILWINNFLHNSFRYKHTGCSSITDEVEYFAEHGRSNMTVGDLSDVDLPWMSSNKFLRYLGGVWTSSSVTDTRPFYYEKNMSITFGATSNVGPMNWGGKVELPKDSYGAYDENTSIEIILPALNYGQTPLSCKLETIDNKKYLCISMSPFAGANGITFKIRFWKKNPEIEKIKTLRQDTSNVTWMKSQVGGKQLGDYLVTPLQLEDHKMIEANTGTIITLSEGDSGYNNYKISNPVPLLSSAYLVFLSTELEQNTFWGAIEFDRIGFYDENDNPLGAIDCNPHQDQGYCTYNLLPQSGSTSMQKREYYRDLLAQNPKTFRVFVNYRQPSSSPYGIVNANVVIQDCLATTTYDKFIAYYCTAKWYNVNLKLNSYITDKLGNSIQGSILCNQIRDDSQIYVNQALDIETGELIAANNVNTTDFIPVSPITINGIDYIISLAENISTVRESVTASGWQYNDAWRICAYDENKQYLGYFRSVYMGNFNEVKFSPMMLRTNAGPSCVLPTYIGDSTNIKYIRYTYDNYTFSYTHGNKGLVLGPH